MAVDRPGDETDDVLAAVDALVDDPVFEREEGVITLQAVTGHKLARGFDISAADACTRDP